MWLKISISSKVRQNTPKPLIKKTLARAGLFFSKDKRVVEMAVVLLDDQGMRKLNKKYRHKDKITNVLSFSTRDGLNLKKNDDLGDIFICWPEAKREAKKYGLSIKEELNRLLVHGFLHLLGYDHVKDKEAEEMEKLEKKILE